MARKQSQEIVEAEAEKQEIVGAEKQEIVEENKPVNTDSKKGMLFSRLNYAAKYVYNGEECMITPKGKIKVDNVDLIKQPLTAGLLLRKID